MTLGEITDADSVMNPQHFGSDPADIRIRIRTNLEIWIESRISFVWGQSPLAEVCALRVWAQSSSKLLLLGGYRVMFHLLTVQLTEIEKTMPRGRRRTKKPASCLDNHGQVQPHGSSWTEYDCRHCQCKVLSAWMQSCPWVHFRWPDPT